MDRRYDLAIGVGDAAHALGRECFRVEIFLRHSRRIPRIISAAGERRCCSVAGVARPGTCAAVVPHMGAMARDGNKAPPRQNSRDPSMRRSIVRTAQPPPRARARRCRPARCARGYRSRSASTRDLPAALPAAAADRVRCCSPRGTRWECSKARPTQRRRRQPPGTLRRPKAPCTGRSPAAAAGTDITTSPKASSSRFIASPTMHDTRIAYSSCGRKLLLQC